MNTQQIIDHALQTTIGTMVPTIVLNPHKEIIFANQAFADALAYDISELLTLTHQDLCFATYTEHPQYQIFWNTILGGQQFQEQILRKTKDGNKVFFEALYSPITNELGEVSAIVCLAFNTTARAKHLGGILHEIKAFTNRVTTLATDGVEHIGSTLTGVNETQSFTAKNKATSTTLLHETEQANDIITVIQDVAHQTRMLAVNSAIEAARLNEHGGSFTVISQEIRKLSNQVREEAVNIHARISKIEEQVTILATEANQIHSMNADSVDKLSVILSSYKELQTRTTQINEIYLEIGHLFEQQKS